MGWSTAVISPPDGNMADYFASLRKLLPRDETLYIPTHGSEIRNPNPFVQAYIEHRLGREAQIMARLKEGPQTIPQMVAKNYADTPLHLHAAAGRSMLAHLIQMAKDGRVRTDDGQARIDSTYRL
jgi:glyoxylase-like metal-dependent hydrolase (beta-lactamase superfamily II)